MNAIIISYALNVNKREVFIMFNSEDLRFDVFNDYFANFYCVLYIFFGYLHYFKPTFVEFVDYFFDKYSD
jgi:hypothetical protein